MEVMASVDDPSQSQSQSDTVPIRFTVKSGSPLRKYLSIKSTWIAEISLDGGQKYRAEKRARWRPNWDYSLELNVSDSSEIKISVYLLTKIPRRQEELRGHVIIPLKPVLEKMKSEKTVVNRYELEKLANNRSSTPYISIEVCRGDQPRPPEAAAQSESDDDSDATSENEKEDPIEMVSSTDIVVANLTPSEKMANKYAQMRSYLQLAIKLGDSLSEVHPFAKLAFTVFMSIPTGVLAQLERDKQIEELWSTAVDMLDFLKNADTVIDDTVSPIVSAMLKQIYDCSNFIREYGGAGFIRRSAKGTFSNVNDIIKEFTDSFKTLRQRFNERSTLTTWKIIRKNALQLGSLVEAMSSTDQSRLLDNLPGAKVANVRWDLGNVCLPRTRQALLDEIVTWANSSEGSNIFWLHGVAGSGKSTVANTVAYMFDGLERLIGSFRFSRDVAARNDPANLFGNLTYQLARFNVQLRQNVLQTIDNHGDLGSLPLSNQLRILIVDILAAVQFAGPVMIVIDAVDESGDEVAREDLLSALASEAVHIPKYVRIFVTSRDEADIRAYLRGISTSKSIDVALDTGKDIQEFIEYRMNQIKQRYPSLPPGWPEYAARMELAARAHGLFQWAAVVCRYIQSFDPEERLDEILAQAPADRGEAESALDKLYLDILQRVCVNIPTSAFQYVFGTILLLRVPFTRLGLDMFLGLGKNNQNGHLPPVKLSSSESIIISLGSLLRVEHDGTVEDDMVIRVLHPSLIDFFLDDRRCTDSRFFIRRSEQQDVITQRCIQVMKAMLRRDICEINDPTMSNSSVPDLASRVRKHIPEHLSYACRYWAYHLCQTTSASPQTIDTVKSFFFEDLLHWLEAMSLLKIVDDACPMLQKARAWFEIHSSSDTASLEVLYDAINMIRRFYTPITQNAAQIYISALPFLPFESQLSKAFSRRYDDVPRVLIGQNRHWSSFRGRYGFPGHSTPISSDGTLFFVTYEDCVLQVRSFLTGEVKATIVALAHRWISYARFHGAYIVTAGSDATIRVWDANTGAAIGRPCGPFEMGYGWSVKPGRVAVSLKSSRVAAIFNFDVLQIWDLASGETIATYYNKRREECSPQFSPDGVTLYVAWKKSVFVIDALTGSLKHEYNLYDENQTDKVESITVEFSPDGTKMLCLPRGQPARLCRIQTGENISALSDTSRHAFSPDGEYLVCIGDGVLTLWRIADKNVQTVLTLHEGTTYGDLHWSYRGYVMFTTDKTLHFVEACTAKHTTFSLPESKLRHVSWVSGSDCVVVLFNDRSVWVYDKSEEMRRLGFITANERPYIIALSPNQQLLITSESSKVTLWDVHLLQQHGSGAWSDSWSYPPYRPRIAVRPVSLDAVAIGYEDGTIRVWDTDANSSDVPPTTLLGHTGKINCLVFSRHGDLFASGSSDSSVRIWSSRRLELACSPLLGHRRPVVALDFFPNGDQILTVSEDTLIRLWSTISGEQLHNFPISSTRIVPDILMVSSDGSTVFGGRGVDTSFSLDLNVRKEIDLQKYTAYHWTRSSFESWAHWISNDHIRSVDYQAQTQLWDANTATLVKATGSLPIPHSHVWHVSFSVDRRYIFCAHEVYRVIVQDSTTAISRSIGDSETGHNADIDSMQFSSDGKLLATTYNNGSTCIWDVTSGLLVSELQEIFSKDQLAVINGKKLSVCDTASGSICWSLIDDDDDSESVMFSRDGRYVVCEGRYGKWMVYGADSGELIATTRRDQPSLRWYYWVKEEDKAKYSDPGLVADPENGLPEPIPLYKTPEYRQDDRQTSFSDTNRALTATASTVLSFCVLDAQEMHIVSSLAHDGRKIAFDQSAFSLDGSMVGLVCRHSILILDVSSGRKIGEATLSGHPPGVEFNVYKNYDNAYETLHPPVTISSFGFTGTGQELRVAAIVREKQRSQRDRYVEDELSLCLWDCQGNIVNVDALPNIRLWDPVFFPDANRLLMHSGSRHRAIQIVDVSAQKATKKLQLIEQFHQRFSLSNVSFSSDQTRFAHLDRHDEVSVYDLETGSVLYHGLWCYHNSEITTFQFSPLLNKMLFTTYDHTILVWDLEKPASADGNPISTFPAQMQAIHSLERYTRAEWFRGPVGHRLLWIPGHERNVRLAANQKLVLEPSTADGDGPLVIDVSRYISHPALEGRWRDGGVSFLPVEYSEKVSPDALAARRAADLQHQ
ncbi:hypothetical protein WG66_006823 [Moniliophthora roreri]|nr:hypothetical protein WG66_006823 [Moniliophthora roreri]